MLGQRGDTIIEVLLAITVFSMVSVGAMTIMNQGANAAQRAIEITMVRQQIDSQADALRAAHEAFTAKTDPDTSVPWDEIAVNTDTKPFNSESACPERLSDIADSFIMDPRDASVVPSGWFKQITDVNAPPFAQVEYSSGSPKAYGIWVERKRELGANNFPNAYNFTIHACWYTAGISDRPLHIETLVRLYDPEG